MSHDQKPARVRVLDAGAATPGRRRDDAPATVIDGKPTGTPPRRRLGIVGALAFLVGTAIGGAGVAWLGIGLS